MENVDRELTDVCNRASSVDKQTRAELFFEEKREMADGEEGSQELTVEGRVAGLSVRVESKRGHGLFTHVWIQESLKSRFVSRRRKRTDGGGVLV